MKVELEEDSIGYTRISTHLKFLAERIFRDDASSVVDTTSDIREMLKEDARLALCINRIVKLIKERYNYDLSPDEQTYLCIHIKRIPILIISIFIKYLNGKEPFLFCAYLT